ncbi:2-keto-3-deoxygluconate permease [Allosaccharopolyspora coralli]|uniref:2-keto-3-deoxygluconate permease n=1 Tax=Allosaccharopolyspora coralli TaxID=2665642 RepID=UPI001C9E5115
MCGLLVAFLTPEGSLWSLLPLAIIAAMSNSNGSLYVALTSEFGVSPRPSPARAGRFAVESAPRST